jgi:hypothetical protein
LNSAIATLLAFTIALLAGLLVKAAYLAFPPVGKLWRDLSLTAESIEHPKPDLLLAVLMSLPTSAGAAVLAAVGMSSNYFFVPLLWPMIVLLPYQWEGRKYFKRIKHWKLEILEASGVAFSILAALYAFHWTKSLASG